MKRRGAQSSLHKHTHLVIEKHVDCKWIDAERDGDDKRLKERKKERNKSSLESFIVIHSYNTTRNKDIYYIILYNAIVIDYIC